MSMTFNSAALAAAFSVPAADHRVAEWFHLRLNASTGPILQAISFTGGPALMTAALVAAVLWLLLRRRWHAAATLVFTVPGGILLGEALKLIVRRHRPYLVGPFVDWSGYSFPSGHAISATLFYGFAAVLVIRAIRSNSARAAAAVAAATITLLIGFSRIALGAHYLSDVIAGILLGLLWLAVCSVCGDALRRRLAPQPVAISAPVLTKSIRAADTGIEPVARSLAA